jgi:Na+/phosphate symporter
MFQSHDMKGVYPIIGMFGIAAILGIYLLTLVLANKNTSKGVAFAHGFMAILALAMLIVYSLSNIDGPAECVVLFGIAAFGGLVLIYKDLSGKPIPKWLALGHGIIAVLGFVFLILFACHHTSMTSVTDSPENQVSREKNL